MSYTREQLETWLSKIDVNGTVLDVGGMQKPIKGRTRTWKVDDYVILDIDEKADVVFDINNSKRHGDLFGFNKKFDNIFCLEVSEYLVNPLNAILNLSDWLDEDGTLYMSFHFIYPMHKPEGTDMLRYTDNWIKNALTHYGFKYIDIQPRVARGDLMTNFYLSEGMKAGDDAQNNITGWLVKGRK